MNNALLVTKHNNIATLTLNRAETHNAFDDLLIQQLTAALTEIENDAEVRVVILTAIGKSFCAGADIHWMSRMADYSRRENLRDADALALVMQLLYNLSKPTIALVQGAAYGGGVGLVACCDIALAAPEANFCFSEVKLGIVPAVISPYVLAAIGERAARYYFLTAERFDAQQAEYLGLVHSVIPSAALLAQGKQLAETLLHNSPLALRTAKKLIAEVSQKTIDKQVIQNTVNCIADIRVSAEGQEGLKAFLEKREPSWINSLLHKK